MTIWKGGRGVRASYDTTHVKVPLPIKEKVEAIVKAFKEEEKQKQERAKIFQEEMIEVAKSILAENKSAKVSLEAFLQAIFDKEVTL